MAVLVQPLIKLGAALPTPFDANGDVVGSLMVSHAQSMLDAGCDTLVPFGTTGEGASISCAARMEATGVLIDTGIAADRLVPCIYGSSVRGAADEMRQAHDLGCRGVLLVPPFYFKQPGDNGLFDWYAQVFRLAGEQVLPTLAYHIPGVTGVSLSTPLVTRLANEFPDVFAGVKDSGGDWQYTSALVAEHNDLTILVGHEGHLAKAVQKGARGAISGCMNIAPALVSKLAGGEGDEGIGPLLDWVLDGPVVSNIKALMAHRTGDDAWKQVTPPLETNAYVVPEEIRLLLN